MTLLDRTIAFRRGDRLDRIVAPHRREMWAVLLDIMPDRPNGLVYKVAPDVTCNANSTLRITRRNQRACPAGVTYAFRRIGTDGFAMTRKDQGKQAFVAQATVSSTARR